MSFGFSEYARDGANRFMGDLDVETSRNVCNSFGKSFGVGQDNKATMVDIIYFLLSTQLAAIVNEVSRVVISGEGFRYSFSFPYLSHLPLGSPPCGIP